MISMTIDDKKFRKEVEDFAKKKDMEFRQHVKESTIKMHKDATINAPHVSNFLRHNIIWHMEMGGKGGATGGIVSRANYSEAVEYGRRALDIPVRNKKVLAGHRRYAPANWPFFGGPGGSKDYAIYGKKVHVKATEPQPFMMPAWKKAIDRLYSLIRKSL